MLRERAKASSEKAAAAAADDDEAFLASAVVYRERLSEKRGRNEGRRLFAGWVGGRVGLVVVGFRHPKFFPCCCYRRITC